MPRRTKSGRFTKRTTRRKSKPKTNIANLAVGAVVANSVTTGLFNANIVDFFTGRRDGKYVAGADGSERLTLPELLGLAGKGGVGGTYSAGMSFQDVLIDNFKKNAVPMIATIVLAPVVANMATKALRKPVILPANRMLKSTGLDVKLA